MISKRVPGVKAIHVIEDPEVRLHSGRVEGGRKVLVLRCWQMFVEGRKSVRRRSKEAPKAPSACRSMHAARMASPTIRCNTHSTLAASLGVRDLRGTARDCVDDGLQA